MFTIILSKAFNCVLLPEEITIRSNKDICLVIASVTKSFSVLNNDYHFRSNVVLFRFLEEKKNAHNYFISYHYILEFKINAM